MAEAGLTADEGELERIKSLARIKRGTLIRRLLAAEDEVKAMREGYERMAQFVERMKA